MKGALLVAGTLGLRGGPAVGAARAGVAVQRESLAGVHDRPVDGLGHQRDVGAGRTRVTAGGERADALQADAERKHTEIMGTINQQRSVLEGRIEQLKTFEREYRTRLKTYLESQLEELQQRGSAAPVDNARGGDAFSSDPGNGGFTNSGGFNKPNN